MILTSIKSIAKVIVIFVFLSGASCFAANNAKEHAYFSVLSHLSAEEFTDFSNSGDSAICNIEGAGSAFEFFSKQEFEKSQEKFQEASVIWGVKKDEEWLILLNGYLQVSIDDETTYKLTEEEFQQFISYIRHDFLETRCGG